MKCENQVLRIPLDLNLDTLIQGCHKGYLKLQQDQIAYICDQLIYLDRCGKKHLKKESGFISLSSKYLKQVIKNYEVIIKILVQNDILEVNPSYRNNFTTKSYRFSGDNSANYTKEYAVQTPRFAKKLQELKQDMIVRNQRRLKKAIHLSKWFDKNLVIDKKNAKEWIKNSYSKHIVALEKAGVDGKTYDKAIKNIHNDHKLYHKYVDDFEQQKKIQNIDPSGYRFHTVITKIKKELRNYIKYGSKKLVAFDIQASQPYFSLVLFNPSFYSKSRNKDVLTLQKLYTELFECLNDNRGLAKLKQIGKQAKGLKTSSIDIHKYRRDILQKDFYDVLSKLLGGTKAERAVAKIKIFEILFTNWENVNYSTKIYKAFKKRYPTVCNVFDVFKKRKHRDFALLLQRIESELLLYRIGKMFCAAYPDAPLFSIHDSLATTEEYKNQLHDLIISGLLKLTGATPTLKEERWSPENANVNVEINVNDTNMMII